MKRWIWLPVVAAATILAGCDHGGKTATTTPTPSAGGTPPAASGGMNVGMVTDVGGIQDQSFNMMANSGLEQAKRELKVNPQVVESQQASDYQPNLEALAQKDCKVIFAVGFALADAVNEIAERYPNVQFAIIDSADAKHPNVTGLTFREEEGSFLAGALAGEVTQKNALGFVGGQKIPLIEKFEAGFRAGVKTTNPKATVTAKYTNNWEKVDMGKEMALSLFNGGADIVMHASGKCGLGVIDAAKEKGAPYYAIGVDADQDYLGCADPKHPGPPSRVLASMMKRVDVAVFSVCKELADGKFKPGHREFGVKEEGVGLSPMNFTRSEFSPLQLERVEGLRKSIADGGIKPPKTLKELETWQPPKQKVAAVPAGSPFGAALGVGR